MELQIELISKINIYFIIIFYSINILTMKVGIVWLPNVWKSTLFNALTKSYSADSANFPFCTIEPNVWIVDVKDPRVDKLAEISWSKKIIYATTNFVDIAWLVKGASKWEWLGNKFLANIREVDTIVQVVRYFKDNDVIHVEWWVDIMRDIDIINSELILSDLEQIDSKLWNLSKRARAKDKEAMELFPLLEKIKTVLSEWKLAYDIINDLNENEKILLKQYNLLTFKPFIYAINVWEDYLLESENIKNKFRDKLNKPISIVCAKLEQELLDIDEEEKQEYINDIAGDSEVKIPTLDDLIKLAYDNLWLMYYFTSWEKETRAWTIKKWYTAPQAAWAIHTDFERWFIKAEVVNYENFLEAGWWKKVKEKWYIRLEWKEYIVQDGDVILFKFNV